MSRNGDVQSKLIQTWESITQQLDEIQDQAVRANLEFLTNTDFSGKEMDEYYREMMACLHLLMAAYESAIKCKERLSAIPVKFDDE